MSAADGDFGLWGLAGTNVLFFTGYAGVLLKPVTRADWGMLAAFAVFLGAHFAERYGVPFSMHLLAAWHPAHPLTHDAGHLWPLLFGSSAHANVLYLASYGLILGGYGMLAHASHSLRHAQRGGRLATTGLYARLRHPQTVAFGLLVIGFTLQWPTAPTLGLLPLLLALAVRAMREDEETLQLQFGLDYAEYANATPACGWRLPLRREMDAGPA